MKKIYLLMLFAFTAIQAQIPNSDFEQAMGYGLENVAAWGQPFTFAVVVTENGENISDEITWGEQSLGMFCVSVAEPHSGERAMLIRNAYNVTQGVVIPGNVSLFNTAISQSATGWNGGIPLEADADIQFLSFWYQFAPLGNDVAEAKLELFNSNSEMIGTAKIQISEATNAYNYASIPLTVTGVGNPAFITIQFSMAAEGSVPVFGSTLLVDDLRVNPSQLSDAAFGQTGFSIYPTVANTEINVQKNGAAGNYNFKIVNIEGKTISENKLELQSGIPVKIDVSSLSSGFYILKSDGGFATKFIKK